MRLTVATNFPVSPSFCFRNFSIFTTQIQIFKLKLRRKYWQTLHFWMWCVGLTFIEWTVIRECNRSYTQKGSLGGVAIMWTMDMYEWSSSALARRQQNGWVRLVVFHTSCSQLKWRTSKETGLPNGWHVLATTCILSTGELPHFEITWSYLI